jgi:hypothetical protein
LTVEISKRKLQDKVKLIETGCYGFCAQGSIMPDSEEEEGLDFTGMKW